MELIGVNIYGFLVVCELFVLWICMKGVFSNCKF